MRKYTTITLTVLVASLFVVSVAFAVTFPPNVANDVYAVNHGGTANGIPTANDNNDNAGGTPPYEPDIHDAINIVTGMSMTHNYMADGMFVASDSIWSQQTVGTVALIGLTAGNSNTLGYYTDPGVGSATSPLLQNFSGFGYTGDGSAANPFPAAMWTVTGSFGFYLDSTDASGATATYFSEDGLNPMGYDHMMTFALPNPITVQVDFGAGATPWTLQNPYLIAWEDLPWNANNQTLGDDDYDDMMYLVDVKPAVPEPGTLFLLGIGLAGIGVYGRRKQRA